MPIEGNKRCSDKSGQFGTGQECFCIHYICLSSIRPAEVVVILRELFSQTSPDPHYSGYDDGLDHGAVDESRHWLIVAWVRGQRPRCRSASMPRSKIATKMRKSHRIAGIPYF